MGTNSTASTGTFCTCISCAHDCRSAASNGHCSKWLLQAASRADDWVQAVQHTLTSATDVASKMGTALLLKPHASSHNLVLSQLQCAPASKRFV